MGGKQIINSETFIQTITMDARKEYPINEWLETGFIPKNISKDFDPFFEEVVKGDFKSAERILEEIDGEKIFVTALKSLLCRQCGNMEESVRILENFVRSEEVVSLFLCLAKDYLITDNLDKADECIKTLSQIATDERTKALIENQRGLILWHRSKYEEAKEKFENVLERAIETNDSFLESRTCTNLGLTYLYRGECEKALEMFNKALRISKEMGYKERMATAELNIALCYDSLGDYKRAKKYFDECIKSSRGLDGYSKNRLIAGCYTGFGDISLLENKKKEAKKYYEKAIGDITKSGDMQFLSRICIGLSKIYLQEKDLENALEYADKACETAVKISSKKYQAEAYVLRGSVYEAQELYNDALKSYGIAMTIFRNIGDKRNIYNTEQILASFYTKLQSKKRK